MRKLEKWQTEKPVVAYLKSVGAEVHVVDSSAFNGPQKAETGFPDLVGDYQGRILYIELKAPGKRNKIRPEQLKFLKNKISRGCFACVTDSVEHFEALFLRWLPAKGSYVLLADLPRSHEVG